MSHHDSHDSKHKHHVTPAWVYFGVGGALLVFTVITVFSATQLHLGHPYDIMIAMAIATTKALLVMLFFMHLWFDNKMYSLMFSMSIVFLGIFITFTLIDTERRGDIYSAVEMPIIADRKPALPPGAAAHGGEHGSAPAAGHAETPAASTSAPVAADSIKASSVDLTKTGPAAPADSGEHKAAGH